MTTESTQSELRVTLLGLPDEVAVEAAAAVDRHRRLIEHVAKAIEERHPELPRKARLRHATTIIDQLYVSREAQAR